MSYRNYDVTAVEVVDGVTLGQTTTADRRSVHVDIEPDGAPILTTPKGNAPMRVRWMRFSLVIPGGEVSYGIEFGGELTDQRDIDRREQEAIGRGRSVRYLTRTVEAADLAERAPWSLKIAERFRPPYVVAP